MSPSATDGITPQINTPPQPALHVIRLIAFAPRWKRPPFFPADNLKTDKEGEIAQDLGRVQDGSVISDHQLNVTMWVRSAGARK